MEEWMWAIWLGIFVVTLVIEVSVSGLISVWFAISALITMCLSFIPGLNYYWEILIFIVLSFVLLIATRPLAKKLLKDKTNSKTNLNLLIGKEIKLVKKIEPLSKGEAIINGVAWDCESEDNSTIEENSIVEIVSIKGNKLIVKEKK